MQPVIPKNKIIIGGAIGNCVHVAGAYTYLQLAESVGYKTIFLGAAVPIEKWVATIVKFDPAIVCISYRLTPSALPTILDEFFKVLEQENLLQGRLYYIYYPPRRCRQSTILNGLRPLNSVLRSGLQFFMVYDHNRQSAIDNRQSTIGNRQSAIGNPKTSASHTASCRSPRGS